MTFAQRTILGKVGFSFAISLAAWAAVSIPLIRRLEDLSRDLRFVWRGRRPTKCKIVLIKVTDLTMSEAHWWEPRAFWSPRLARLLTALDRYQPAWVGIDFAYQAKTIEYLRKLGLDSEYLRRVQVSNSQGEDPYLTALETHIEKITLPLTWMDASSVDVPARIAALGQLSHNLGSVTFRPDSDGVLRHFDFVQDGAPTFASAIAAKRFGLDPFDNATPANLRARTGSSLGTRPTINYLGHSFPAIDASEVEQLAIAPAQNNLAPAQANELKGAIVLIGPEHYGDDDRHMTPLSQEMSGVEVHANILSTILDGAGIAIWSANQERAAASGMTLLLSLTSLFGSLAKGIGLGAFVLGAWSAGAVFAFVSYRSMLPMGSVLTLGLAALSVSGLVRAGSEARERQRIHSVFGKFVSAEVETHLLKHPDSSRLGGQEFDGSVVFVDIWNSVPRAATRTPSAMMTELNHLFAEIIPCILKNRGIINRFTGDGCLILFGAPVPSVSHADDAVSCCIAVQQAVRKVNLKYPDDPLVVSCGIHSGKFLCGNVGSQSRAEFTVIGDVVNVAKRIETANRELRTRVLMSSECHARLSHKPDVLAMSFVAKGKGAVDVYALTEPDYFESCAVESAGKEG